MRTHHSGRVEAPVTTAAGGAQSIGATVLALSSTGASSILTVRLPGGALRDLVLPAAPDPVLARRSTAGFRRLAWLRIDVCRAEARCRVSGIVRRPCSQRLPLAAALALADAGLPVVVRVPVEEG